MTLRSSQFNDSLWLSTSLADCRAPTRADEGFAAAPDYVGDPPSVDATAVLTRVRRVSNNPAD